ncbi:MAG: hypothetical protein MI747_16965 [Desulfobacterales bacterium]|nr:hypothetical protein [Desulfobacterales bacterium]
MFYNIRHQILYTKFNLLTAGILNTPPMESVDESHARFSIHTTVCKRDLQLYLLAIKSFISFVKGGCIHVHSDGSLEERDQELLRSHIPGICIITPEEAAQRAKEHLSPFLQKVRGYYISLASQLDMILWSKTDYHIKMDCDILTLNSPEFILQWLKEGTSPFIISDHITEKKTPPKTLPQNAHIQAQMEYHQPRIAKGTGFRFGNTLGLCSGFFGWKNHLKLNEIELFLSSCSNMGFDMSQWGSEQVVTTWLLTAHDGVRLPMEKYFNLHPPAFHLIDQATLIHFIGSNRFKNNWYIDKSKQVIARLGTA